MTLSERLLNGCNVSDNTPIEIVLVNRNVDGSVPPLTPLPPLCSVNDDMMREAHHAMQECSS